jgi:hypothetical protein
MKTMSDDENEAGDNETVEVCRDALAGDMTHELRFCGASCQD